MALSILFIFYLDSRLCLQAFVYPSQCHFLSWFYFSSLLTIFDLFHSRRANAVRHVPPDWGRSRVKWDTITIHAYLQPLSKSLLRIILESRVHVKAQGPTKLGSKGCSDKFEQFPAGGIRFPSWLLVLETLIFKYIICNWFHLYFVLFVHFV